MAATWGNGYICRPTAILDETNGYARAGQGGSSGVSLEDAESGLRPRARLRLRRFELTARSSEPWSQKGGTVVAWLLAGGEGP